MNARALLAAISLVATTFCSWGAVLPGGATIKATASSGQLLSLDDAYASAANPAFATLSVAFGDLEFLSDDFALGIDFGADGALRFYDFAGSATLPDLSLDFSFPGLGVRLNAFTLDALPHLAAGTINAAVIDRDTLRITFSGVTLDAAFESVGGTLTVPEPTPLALLALCGLLACAGTRRRHTGR